MNSKQRFLRDFFYLEECRSSEGWQFLDRGRIRGIEQEVKRRLFWFQFKIGKRWLIVSGNGGIVEAFLPAQCCEKPSLDFRKWCDNCGCKRSLAGPARLTTLSASGFNHAWVDLPTAVDRLSPLLPLDSLEAIAATDEIMIFLQRNFVLESSLAAR